MWLCAGENWNEVMYDGMRTTSPASAVYFLFIVLIGNYVVLNLFLAILLDKFAGGDSDGDADKKRRQRGPSVRLSGDDDGDDVDDDAEPDEKSAAFLMRVHVRSRRCLVLACAAS